MKSEFSIAEWQMNNVNNMWMLCTHGDEIFPSIVNKLCAFECEYVAVMQQTIRLYSSVVGQRAPPMQWFQKQHATPYIFNGVVGRFWEHCPPRSIDPNSKMLITPNSCINSQ